MDGWTDGRTERFSRKSGKCLFQAILGQFGPDFGPYNNLPNIMFNVNLKVLWYFNF